MLTKAFIPYKGYWSSPFSRWQGILQHQDSVKMVAAATKQFFAIRGYTPDIFDGIVLGATIPQPQWFYNSPHYASLMGNSTVSGPHIAQACATSTVSVNYAANSIQSGTNEVMLVATTDRMSNGPNILWPKHIGPGGKPDFESWVMDGFAWDPMAETSPTGTAENVAKKHGFTREESDAMAIARYEKYTDALKNDREFQKRYMLPLEVPLSKNKTVVFEEDEGITPCTREGMASLKTKPDSVLTFGAQTHPADGNAGMIVTTREKAAELSAEPSTTIQILGYGFARADKGYMPEASSFAAQAVLKSTGLKVAELAAVKTHNPFTINDLAMQKLLGVDEKIFNNYGSSLVFGHPQGPTTMRLLIELIEELVIKGGGYGLLSGCAAGDSGASLIIKVN